MENFSIFVQNLQFSYTEKEPVLTIPQWSLKKGEHCFLYGPSGCGKTTFLNLIGGVISPKSGQLNVVGQDMSLLSPKLKDRLRAQKIGMIFQQFNLVPYLSVMENIKLAAYFNPQSNNDWQYHCSMLFDAVSLSSTLFDQKASQLSVGQQQRVAIVRSLINQPELLIADEPTSSLDSANRDSFMDLLIKLSKERDISMLFVSHDEGMSKHFSQVTSLPELNLITKQGERYDVI